MSALHGSRWHLIVYLQMPAWPLILTPKDRMASSRSCHMLCKVARPTMVFSWRRARGLIAVRTSASTLPVREPRVRSLLRSSSQHSNSCITTSVPVNLVPLLYSYQRVNKYAHSSLVPAGDTDGHFSLSAFVFVAGAVEVAVCAVA